MLLKLACCGSFWWCLLCFDCDPVNIALFNGWNVNVCGEGVAVDVDVDVDVLEGLRFHEERKDVCDVDGLCVLDDGKDRLGVDCWNGFDVFVARWNRLGVDCWNRLGVDCWNGLGVDVDCWNGLGVDVDCWNGLGVDVDGWNGLGVDVDGWNGLGVDVDGWNGLGVDWKLIDDCDGDDWNEKPVGVGVGFDGFVCCDTGDWKLIDWDGDDWNEKLDDGFVCRDKVGGGVLDDGFVCRDKVGGGVSSARNKNILLDWFRFI